MGVTPAGAASASRSAKGYALCEDGARENGLHRNGHQAQPVRSMSHSVQGSCEHRRTEPAARRQRELPHRESAPRVIEAAGRILRIRHATSSVGFHSLSCFVAALVRADTSGIPPTGERCAVWVAPVPQCGGISLLARYTSRCTAAASSPATELRQSREIVSCGAEVESPQLKHTPKPTGFVDLEVAFDTASRRLLE